MQPLSKDKDGDFEDISGDDFGMDWGGCDDDNWEYGDTGEGVRDGGSDDVMPGTAANTPGAAGWGIGGHSGGAMAAKNEDKEEPMMEEEKTVVYVHITYRLSCRYILYTLFSFQS